MEENGELPRSMLVPLRMLARRHSGGDSSLDRQLAVVVPTTSAITASGTATASKFQLPDGWDVEIVPRPDGTRSDRYFYEPGTGMKFRSTKEVERYLREGEYTPSRKAFTLSNKSRKHKAFSLGSQSTSSGYQRRIASGGMLLRLDKEESNHRQLAVVAPTIAAATSPFRLPDGWVVEEVPRKRHGWTDKYYYEPGTGRKFRSLLSVERYLAEEGDNAPLSQLFKIGNRVKNFSLQKKVSREKVRTSTSDSPEPPAKINWVLADPGGQTWNPFIGESMVPEPIKQRWTNRFTISINDGNNSAPDVEWQS